jgi:hypothetical protein
MSVSSVGSAPAMIAALTAQQATQAQTTDSPHDGDADDVAPVQATPAPGTGQTVDKTA